MKKNNKGFTLIELLAAIIVLGILMIYAVPTVLNLIDNNKEKMYVDAAKKLVAQAEYKMRANSSVIERPERGDVIALSLVYLESTDFDVAPNNGEFIKEASFVVIKNTGSGLEYSATIVEKMKRGGYKGVVLTSSENLEKRNANKYVKIFKESEIVYIEDKKNGSDSLTTQYINNYLGRSYCNNIEAIYNYPQLTGGAIVGDNEAPEIKSLTVESADKYDFNSYRAILSVTAIDDRTLRGNLMIYISLISYDDALASSGEKYGSSEQYKKTFDFSSTFDTYDGAEIPIYVVVKDEDGSIDRKRVTYSLHVNMAPIIATSKDRTFLSKRANDLKNMTVAVLRLDVSDDIDVKEDLDVCLTTKEGSCTEYRRYGEFFGNSDTVEYDFGGSLDGRNVKLFVYVKDKSGLETHVSLDYEIYKNEKPVIDSLEVLSDTDIFTDEEQRDKKGGHLNTKIKVTAHDDFLSSNMRVSISSPGAQTVSYGYNDNADYVTYTLAGNYDGLERTINVTVTDEFGEKATKTYKYKVYKNEAPKIVSASIRSNGFACPMSEYCSVEDGGKYDAYISLETTDDIDYQSDYSDLRVCVSDDRNHCNNNDNFSSYRDYNGIENEFVFSPINSENPYDGSVKKVYVVVKDTYGEIATKELTYKIYENKAPTIEKLTIESDSLDESELNLDFYPEFLPININRAIVSLNAYDDWENESLQVNICKKLGNEEVCDGYKPYSTVFNVVFDDDKYNGQKYEVIVKVKDQYGKVSEKNVSYTFYKDKKPVIDKFDVASESEEYNSHSVTVSYVVRDPFDTYSICFGTANTFSECVKNDNLLLKKDDLSGNALLNSDGDKVIPTTFDYDFPDDYPDISKFYSVVKDSYGNEAYDEINYKMYQYCSETEGEPSILSYTLSNGSKEISASNCGGKCYVKNNDKNITSKYKRVLSYSDKYIHLRDCLVEKEFDKDCSFYKCFERPGNDQTTDRFYIAIGIKKLEHQPIPFIDENGNEQVQEEEGWMHNQDGVVHVHKFYYKIYSVGYDEEDDHVYLYEVGRACPDLYESGYMTPSNGYVLVDDEEFSVVNSADIPVSAEVINIE